MKASCSLVAKFSRQCCKPTTATDVEGVSLLLLFEEVVEEDAAVSLRELNPRFEDEGVMTGSGVEVTGSGVEVTSSGVEMTSSGIETTGSGIETMGSDPGVCVPSCVPR